MKVVDTREYVGMLKELTEEGKGSRMLVFKAVWHRFDPCKGYDIFQKPDRELQKVILYFFGERAGSSSCTGYGRSGRRVLYRGRCTDTDRRTGKREQIFALDHQSQKKRKVLEPGDFWWEFFEHVWLHMIRSAGDYVVLCEGDTVTRLHTDGGNAMMEQ